MPRILFKLSFLIVLLAVGTAGNAKTLEKNLATLESWDNACADGALFMPCWGCTPANSRDAAMEYAKHPNNESWFNRACAYYETGKREQSLESFCNNAIAKHPSWAAPHYYLARCAEREIDDDKTIQEYQKAYERRPCWGQLLMEYTKTLNNAGKYKECVKIANAGLKYRDGDGSGEWAHSRLLLSKGKALLSLHNPKEAVPALAELTQLRAGKKDPLAHSYACEAYLGIGNWTSAIEQANQTMKVNPTDSTPHLSLAHAYSGLGKNDLALRESEIFLKSMGEISERSPEAHKLRASIYERLGKRDLAAAELKCLPRNENELFKDMPFRSTTAGGAAN